MITENHFVRIKPEGRQSDPSQFNKLIYALSFNRNLRDSDGFSGGNVADNTFLNENSF